MNKLILSRALTSLKMIGAPKMKFEQYQTDVKTAVAFLFFADSVAGLKSMRVADLGCGNGILGIGAALFGAEKVDMYDIDYEAVNITTKNTKLLGLTTCNSFCADFFDVYEKYDVVLSNPPFGFQTNFNMDKFLEKLREMSPNVFVLYKYNNIAVTLAKKNGFGVYKLGDMRLKRTAAFHKKNALDIPVCIIYRTSND